MPIHHHIPAITALPLALRARLSPTPREEPAHQLLHRRRSCNLDDLLATAVMRALTSALRRAIVSAMQPERALLVGDDILHPQARLAYKFNIALGHGPNPHILISVSTRHLNVRHVDEDDSDAALIPKHSPLIVLTAPLRLNGTLAPRPCNLPLRTRISQILL